MPNHVSALSRIEDPSDTPRHKIDVLGGAEAQIVTGRKTRFGRFGRRGKQVFGQVVDEDTRKPVTGRVLVRVHTGKRDGPYAYRRARLSKGSFNVALDDVRRPVDAYYIPAKGFADCWSELVKPRK